MTKKRQRRKPLVPKAGIKPGRRYGCGGRTKK